MLKDNIKRRRMEKGLTQQQLADKVGIARSSIARAEIGSKALSFETLKIVAQILDCTLDELGQD